jgi:hypothetical protein
VRFAGDRFRLIARRNFRPAGGLDLGDNQPAGFLVDGISCIVCTYNEGDRLRRILDAVSGHPALQEIIVVNDGSTDDAHLLLQAYRDVRVISYTPNRGKTYAMSRGIAAAKCDRLMFLDADLAGLSRRHIQLLAAPVVGGAADVSISLRGNSLPLYRMIGLDFVSGERVIPASLVRDQASRMAGLPPWGGEAFINQLIIEAALRIEVVDWPEVTNVRKHRKLGRLRGLLAELSMIRDAFRTAPGGPVRQNLELLRLMAGARRAARLRPRDKARLALRRL